MPLALTSCASTNEFASRAIRAAEYYGFRPLEELTGTGTRTQIARVSPRDLALVHRDEKSLIPLVNACAAGGLATLGKPVFLWRPGAVAASGARKSVSIELHILGVPAAIAEALLITVAQAIAADAGLERRIVRVNSIGSPESSARYVRELGTYLRKNSEAIAENILTRVPADPLGALLSLVEKQSPVIARAPQSMEFLNEEERHHLASVLEYLEAVNTYYELNPFVLGSRDCWTHTIFEVHGVHPETEELVPFAKGGRYDKLISRALGGTPASGVGLTLTFELRGAKAPSFTRIKHDGAIPSLYFAHLSTEARQRGIMLLETLRHAGIHAYQSLAYEHLSEQMAEAQALHVPYMLIMGYKEATEGTVLVRDTYTNSQVAVPAGELIPYLKRHRIAA